MVSRDYQDLSQAKALMMGSHQLQQHSFQAEGGIPTTACRVTAVVVG